MRRVRNHEAAHASRSRPRRIQSTWAEICSRRRDESHAAPEKASVCRRRAAEARYASSCGRPRGLRHGFRSLCPARRLGGGLFKDTQNLALKLRKVHGEHDAARMKDEIAAWRQEIDVATESLAHAALDAIAFVGLADDLADRETDARCRWSARISHDLRGEEPAHGRGLPLAAGGVGALIIGVLAQARARQRLALSRLGS